MKLLWRTDVHLSERNPRSRTDNWREAIMDKLRQVGGIAKEIGAEAVIDGGDFFDIKSPSRNSHDLIREVAELHADYPCPVYANVGNHDCVYGDYTYLPQQPLGVLFATGVFKRLYDSHEAVFADGGVKVRLAGIPYHGTTYDLDRFKNITKGDEDYLVVTAHVLASAKGGSMFENEDIIKYDDLIETRCRRVALRSLAQGSGRLGKRRQVHCECWLFVARGVGSRRHGSKALRD